PSHPLPRPPHLLPYTTLFRSEPATASSIRALTLAMFSYIVRHALLILILLYVISAIKIGTINRITNDNLTLIVIIIQKAPINVRSEEHTSELQSRFDLVCRLL